MSTRSRLIPTKGSPWMLAIVLSLVAVLGCGAPSLAATIDTAQAPTAQAPATGEVSSNVAVVAAFEGTLENVYEQVSPSVVNIQVVQKVENPMSQLPDFGEFNFFGQPFEAPNRQQEPQYSTGTGSGFVWDQEGHIVTNNHVVEGADKITVTFSDGATEEAQLVGRDPDSDLAVIQVDTKPSELEPVEMADSTQVKVGQMCIAIGNPYGLEGTMTVGIVSALGRLLPTETETGSTSFSIPDIIQTDASINPGNSGGVLVDENGKVMGVTSAIVSPVRASAGIGFAIPSAIVQKVVPALIDEGEYTHAWLGISGTSLTPDLAKAAGMDEDQRGALVVDVVPDGPADKAGLRGSDREIEVDGQKLRTGGDVVTALNGQDVDGFDDIVTYLARDTQAGDTITLTLLRGDETQDVKVKLEARPSQELETRESARGEGRGAWLGINGLPLTPEIADAMGLDKDQSGVLVAQVMAGSPADEAGLRGSYKPMIINGESLLVGGDVIVGVDGEDVTDMAGLQSHIAKVDPGDTIELTVLRDRKTLTLDVTLGEQQQ